MCLEHNYFYNLMCLVRNSPLQCLHMAPIWQLERPRTNYGTQRVSYTLPKLLNIYNQVNLDEMNAKYIRLLLLSSNQ